MKHSTHYLYLKQLQEELSFQTGQIINVYGEMDDDGFYLGEIDGQRGLVPSNFLAEVTDQYNQQGGMNRGQQGGGNRGHGPGARGPPPPPRDHRMGQRKTGILGLRNAFVKTLFLLFLFFFSQRSRFASCSQTNHTLDCFLFLFIVFKRVMIEKSID